MIQFKKISKWSAKAYCPLNQSHYVYVVHNKQTGYVRIRNNGRLLFLHKTYRVMTRNVFYMLFFTGTLL